jgi:hypothetical protein
MCVMLHRVVHILTRILSTLSLCIRLKLVYFLSLSLSLVINHVKLLYGKKLAFWYYMKTGVPADLSNTMLRTKNGEKCIMCSVKSVLFNSFFLWRCEPTRALASSFTRFLDHSQRRTTVSRTPLDEWSARHRDLYLTTHNTHNRQTSMPRWDSKPQSQQASGRRPTP